MRELLNRRRALLGAVLIALAVSQSASAVTTHYTNEAAFLAAAGPVELESFEGELATNTFGLSSVLVDEFEVTGGDYGIFRPPVPFPNGTHPTHGEQYVHAQGFDSLTDSTFELDRPTQVFGFTITDLEDCAGACGTSDIVISTDAGDMFTILPAGTGTHESKLFVGIINDDQPFSTVTLSGFSGADAHGIDGVYYTDTDPDDDGVDDPLDLCPNTVVPESVPTVRLGVNRFALVDGDGFFDTRLPPGNGPDETFTLDDTAGCSCEQIIETSGAGQGHSKFGCSLSLMREWVIAVNP